MGDILLLPDGIIKNNPTIIGFFDMTLLCFYLSCDVHLIFGGNITIAKVINKINLPFLSIRIVR
ncbi:MAG: hypothetical protein CBD32_03005 [Actinobacteria bacterium TMED172]|nr:hypothetical protein [Cellvibrionales bacterium]OUW33434.1 MAG: hypothetical protein CBD32_03005 [Actinobacteria bacterium TMED172]|tara:strand:+ start:20349 stop:20540 length:192 start_codon:yes stop_codon:yes gene_type:complete